MMRLQAVVGISLRQIYLIRGTPMRVLPMFAWVAIDIVIWGFMTQYLDSISDSEINFKRILLGAVVFWLFFLHLMQGVTAAFSEDIYSRNFLNLFSTPLSLPEYLAGLVLTSVGTSASGLVFMAALATAIFSVPFISLGIALIPSVLVLGSFGVALGIFASALIMRLGQSFAPLVLSIPALLAPFAGVFYPLSSLPPWMRYVGYLLPPSYVFECLRMINQNQPISSPVLLIGAFVLSIVYVLLSSIFFTRVFRYAVRTGLLARYSATGGS